MTSDQEYADLIVAALAGDGRSRVVNASEYRIGLSSTWWRLDLSCGHVDTSLFVQSPQPEWVLCEVCHPR